MPKTTAPMRFAGRALNGASSAASAKRTLFVPPSDLPRERRRSRARRGAEPCRKLI